MIRETITFKFVDEAQQRRFHDRLNTLCRCEKREDVSEEISGLRLALTRLSNDGCWVYGERAGFCVVQEERDATGKHIRTLSSMIPWSLVEKALKGRPKGRNN